MNRNQRSFISVLLVMLIIALLIFFWIASNGSDMESNLISTNSVENEFSLSVLATNSPLTTTPPTVTPYPTETPTPTPTTTPTITPTATATLTFSGYEVIGTSVLELPLEVYRFGTGEHAYLVVAGIHGGYEWNTVSLALELIDRLKQEPERRPADKTLYILPNLNPDGYAKDKGPDGRANANNVDINRNWDSNWATDWDGEHCWSYRVITAGEEPESEPETRALKNFLLDRNVKAVISYHSQGAVIFSGGYPYDLTSVDLANNIWAVSPYYYPPDYSGCQYTGQFIDWASDQGIAALDIELRNHADTDYLINVNILDAFLKWEYPRPVD